MQITMFQRARPVWPAKKKTENGDGNRDGKWNFCRVKKADVTLFLQMTRVRKIKLIFEAN